MTADAARPISPETAEHYLWSGTCDGWHLLRSADLAIIQGRARQFFCVLRGRLTLECAGTHHSLISGQGLEIAPGLPHEARRPPRTLRASPVRRGVNGIARCTAHS